MNLAALLAAAGLPEAAGAAGAEARGVTNDSRRVEAGFVFVAVRGVPLPSRAPLDGHEFIAGAVARGAVAVIGTRDVRDLSVPYVRVPDDRAALADLAAAFHGFPARHLHLAGVTGTKGKTTVTVLTHHLLEHAGVNAARLSTVGARWAGEDRPLSGHFTTPEAPEVQALLASFVQAGCSHAVVETSSHALALDRVRGLHFDVGVFTNLGEDHLDFHGSVDAYFAAKRALLERSSFGVLNADDARYPFLPGLPHWSYGERGDWRAEDLRDEPGGLAFTLVAPGARAAARVPLIGHFNAWNALAASAAAARLGVSVDAVVAGLASFPGVPGRMQIVRAEPFRVINDFAHTGASVRAALESLRSSTAGRLIIVVGAAGLQDPGRRTGIGRAAGELADLAVFTEEDHRSEPLDAILDAMSGAAREVNGRYRVIPDRRDAIRWACAQARPGDTVLLAGKGHERTLERGADVVPWDETTEALAALEELGGSGR